MLIAVCVLVLSLPCLVCYIYLEYSRTIQPCVPIYTLHCTCLVSTYTLYNCIYKLHTPLQLSLIY